MSKYTTAQKRAWITSQLVCTVAMAYDDIEFQDCDIFQSLKRDHEALSELYMDYHTEGDEMPTLDFDKALEEYEAYLDTLPLIHEGGATATEV